MLDALAVLIRALSFIAIFEGVGGALFLTLFGAGMQIAADVIRHRLRLIIPAAAVLLLAYFCLEAPRMAGDLSGLWDRQLQQLAWHSAPGAVLRLQLIGLLLVFAGLGLRHFLADLLCVVGLLVILAGFASVGHTVDHGHRGWLVALLIVHLASVAFWFGALWPLRQAVTLETPGTAAAVLEGFSRAAVWIVPGLLVAGVSLIVLLVPGLAVFGETYGRLLLIKLSGFSALMVLAGLNKLRLTPALRQQNPRAVPRLRRVLGLEYLIIAAVLAVTALMTGLYSPD